MSIPILSLEKNISRLLIPVRSHPQPGSILILLQRKNNSVSVRLRNQTGFLLPLRVTYQRNDRVIFMLRSKISTLSSLISERHTFPKSPSPAAK